MIDLSGTRVIDGRFFGLLLMLRKHLNGREEIDIYRSETRDPQDVSAQRCWVSALI